MGELTLIFGGARSGKSKYAQEQAARIAGGAPVIYIATAQAGDDEMRDRIDRHRRDRPTHWLTIEEPIDVANVVRSCRSPSVILIDCLTFFIVNHMLRMGDAATCDIDEWDEAGPEAAVDQLLGVIQSNTATVLLVSNEVGMGLVPETPLGRAFRDVAGRANQLAAASADRVFLMVAGIPVAIKP